MWIAKKLSVQLSANLIPIALTIDKKEVITPSDILCLVFPAYLAQRYGLPGIVEDFVNKIANLSEKKVFAVCTCGGRELVNALPTLKRLDKALVKHCGNGLLGAFSIKLPMNNLDYPSRLINQNQAIMFSRAQVKIQSIGKRILAGQSESFKRQKSAFNLMMKPLYGSIQHLYVRHLQKMAKEPAQTKMTYFELVRHSDRNIEWIEERCTGCAICAKVCPARNIQMVREKPVWKHRCEMCLACDEWCPSKAIRHWCKTPGKDYHHPEIDLKEMLEQALLYEKSQESPHFE